MPKPINTAMTLKRLLAILLLMKERPSATSPFLQEMLLARGHNVTLRTVQRDLQHLADAQLVEAWPDEGRTNTWRWHKDSEINKIGDELNAKRYLYIQRHPEVMKALFHLRPSDWDKYVDAEIRNEYE